MEVARLKTKLGLVLVDKDNEMPKKRMQQIAKRHLWNKLQNLQYSRRTTPAAFANAATSTNFETARNH